jgi:hypothetical protein
MAWLFLTPVSPGSDGCKVNRSATGEELPYAAKSGIVIESLSGQGMILNRKLARHYRRLLTESAGGGRIARRMQNRKVILRASVRYRCVVGPERILPGALLPLGFSH